MAYEARVKPTCRWKSIRFSGNFEFVKYEWRPLPDDKLEAARGNPYLEVRQIQVTDAPIKKTSKKTTTPPTNTKPDVDQDELSESVSKEIDSLGDKEPPIKPKKKSKKKRKKT